ncbi:hypothetical protein CEP51_008828 [Fusarium floridanum]|uniref:Uncharacterized protein n=1 Tax=Fusarium floridanum TaxID=1325733 RepID=A0A428RJI4_9HYPO|nr:hypothetical protein CEP51_008828 [Fusarium floridanum]
MNWYPGWFAQESCNSKASQWSRSLTAGKYHMVNYQCREQSMVHELFHIDANWQRHAPGNGHIMDRNMIIKGETGKKKVYGPLYTKVLARWAKDDVGHYVATNADNLAYYFLGKWVQEVFGVYPHLPITDQVPLKFVQPGKRDDGPVDPPTPPTPPTDNPWDTPEIWDPIRVVDGEVRMGDLNDLADALGVESIEEARTLYDDDPEACFDFVAQDENDENPVCADSDEGLELDASQEIIPPVDPVSAAETTSQPLLNSTHRLDCKAYSGSLRASSC